jgi:predicted amidophosphoribosyltransferase
VRRCVECTGRRLGFSRARAAIVYDERTRPLVSAWKERGRRDLVEPFAALVAEVVAPPSVDAVTFVPGDRERGRDRGHVPVARLARALADRWDLPVDRLLARSGPATRQAGLSRADRRANVRDLFIARRAAHGRLVLVDDVYTTGATAASCATTLRRAGARSVEVVCLARAVR